jgi:SpoVK/Ycf46/Vps4 family AAA+-type ATPase
MPLPDREARKALIDHKLQESKKDLSEEDMEKVYSEVTDGYSCADLAAFVKETAMAPVRELTSEQL